MSNHLMNTYAPMPIAFERGKGAWLWDQKDNQYLDAISGLGVNALGHAHPEVTAVIQDQAAKLLHTANLAQVPWQGKLADKLAAISGLDQAFFGNSGAEVIECALKLCRLWGHAQGIDQPQIVVTEDSFHGRTLATLSAGGSRKAQAGYEPLVSGFIRVPFGDAQALQDLAGSSPNVVAVLAEPIQGESGVRVPPEGYLSALREICDQQGWLLVMDEIQAGLCRTGYWYAHQHEGIRPDIIASAKALANGLPIGACIASEAVAANFVPGKHGSTFGGNPLVSRTACTVLEVMQQEGLARQAAETGDYMLDQFRQRLAHLPIVTDIRGRGLMIGIELDQPAAAVKDGALQQQVLINVTRESVVRLLPPLIIDRQQADQIISVVCDQIQALA